MSRLQLIGTSHSFSAGDGAEWTVGEYTETLAAAGAGHCLIFSGEGVFRRVREFPADWRDLSAESLLALSWTR